MGCKLLEICVMSITGRFSPSQSQTPKLNGIEEVRGSNPLGSKLLIMSIL